MYEPYRIRSAYYCKVRVNNREYGTDVGYRSEDLARESAATKAFMICRNFSANDGMLPGQRPGGGVVQGLPVAIGTGRRMNRNSNSSVESYSDSSSGSNSPKSSDEGFHRHAPQYAQQPPRRRVVSTSYSYVCGHGRVDCVPCSRGW